MPLPKRLLLFAARLIVIGTVAWWAWHGARRGWSQNRVPISQIDEVTGIAYTTYENRFVPGVDALAAGLILGGVLWGSTFFIRNHPNPRSTL